jgi:hypothetical protein
MKFTEPKTFSSLSDKERDTFFEYLKTISMEKTRDLAIVNMWNSDWENDPKTLMYLLCKTEQFSGDNGNFHIIFDELGDVACCAGVYKSDFDKSFGLLTTRAWVTKRYRNLRLLGLSLTPVQKKWCIDNNCRAAGFCTNEYNKNIVQMWKRLRAGENDRPPFNENDLFYTGLYEVEFPIIIKYTKQWLAYEKFDSTYEFDWESIRAIE